MFRSGLVLTADVDRPRATAVAVEDGRIVALDEAAERLAGDGATVVDLTGRTLVPGFRDGHIHPLWGGTESLDAPVTTAVDVDDLLARVARHAGEHPEASWVLGHGYPPEVLPGGLATAAQLDAVVGDRPAALWASDHHTMWVSSAALRLAGITAATPDPPRGAIGRGPDGEPTGMLFEAGMDLVADLIPQRGGADKATGLRRALAALRAAGIVWAQEAALAPDDVAVYLDVEAAGDLTADINIALRTDPATWREQRGAFAAAAREVRGASQAASPGRVSVRTVKVFADGVIESGTGALLEPYSDAPHSCGIANWEAEELVEAACAFDQDGFQLHIHAIGDAAVRLALDAVEAVAARNGPRDRRPVIAHTQLVDPHDLPRFAATGTIANFEPYWAMQSPVMTELTEPRLGPRRSAQQYPIATLLRQGAHISFGSDWPVSSMSPVQGLSTAMTRETEHGIPPGGWTPHERLTLDEAIRAYTAGVAFQGYAFGTGKIVPGADADLCLLGSDLAAIAPDKIPDVPVEALWLRGSELALPPALEVLP